MRRCGNFLRWEIYFSAPVTNSGEGRLFKGERIRITHISPQAKPIWALANPVRYRAVEERFLPQAQREPPYSHFMVVLKVVELHALFRRVEKWTIASLIKRSRGA